MIGPEPMIMIFLMSVRFGMRLSKLLPFHVAHRNSSTTQTSYVITIMPIRKFSSVQPWSSHFTLGGSHILLGVPILHVPGCSTPKSYFPSKSVFTCCALASPHLKTSVKFGTVAPWGSNNCPASRAVVRSPRSNGTEFNAGLEMWRGQGAAGEDGLGREVRFRCAAARDVQDRDAEQDVASTQSEMRRPRLHAGKCTNRHDGDDVGRLRGARVTMRNMKRQQF